MVGPSLDHFIVITNILFIPKWSRLAKEKCPVRFSNGPTIQKLDKKVWFFTVCVRFCPVFEWFFNKMAAKAIQKPDTKSVQKMIKMV
jgi:hypothetical protein